MIAFLRGEVVRIDSGSVVLDVAGVGYNVFVGTNTSASLRVGDTTTIHTAHIIREDSSSLYGFLNTEELSLFNLLGSVNGVGPKTALGILSQLGAEGVHHAVAQADDARFKSVTGVGPKTAKLIVLSLTGKLVLTETPGSDLQQSIVAALVTLGYQDRVARTVVAEIDSTGLDEAEVLKLALANLAKAKKVS